MHDTQQYFIRYLRIWFDSLEEVEAQNNWLEAQPAQHPPIFWKSIMDKTVSCLHEDAVS